ncbi:response regulator transcription factor [Algibacter sp. PT7-4]|uniref:response regulator transcription factor n=1 Tax=Algibacter ulvanivorans TaxID=3400999 RepID=UPI003AAC717C
MINKSKINNSNPKLPIAGVLPSDNNVEFIGVRTTKQVIWMQNGCSHYFSDLPLKYFNLLKRAYLKDHKAQRFLSRVTDHLPRQIELFTYYMYGELDATPDISNNVLQPSENFRHKTNCPSLLWSTKTINIGKHILTPRQIVIIDLMAKGLADKQIACVLGIAHKTLDNHKQKLFKDLGVTSKYDVLKLSFQYKIVA